MRKTIEPARGIMLALSTLGISSERKDTITDYMPTGCAGVQLVADMMHVNTKQAKLPWHSVVVNYCMVDYQSWYGISVHVTFSLDVVPLIHPIASI